MTTTMYTGNAERRAADRSAIIEVLHRYANRAVENADFESMAETLFTEDGVFVLPDGRTVPRTEIHQILGGTGPTLIRHHITTIDIEFNSDDEASADSFFMALTDLAQPDHWGRWHDSLRRQDDGRWLLTSKEPIADGFAPHGWLGSILLKNRPAMEPGRS
ncbi:nuclear transport factor 2 family protein [Rhodococcus sp. NPDC076796]|uniref:nuclear transport factor 2 family protein n=1 Tax=Rhodococcus sp. NPDC076796 TaxID=3154859 RepID=UPI00344CDA04